MKKFPQVLKNVKVVDKESVLTNSKILDEITAVEEEMGENGRVLVRPSGTEPLVRVMVEAPTVEECETYVQRIADMIQDLLGLTE